MKKIVALTTIAFLVFSFSPLTNNTNKEKNTAKQLLNKVEKTAKGYKNIIIEFKNGIHNSKENINQETKGVIALQGNKYNLSFMGVTRIFDGKKVYTIVSEDEEVTVSNHDENDANGLTPNTIFNFFKKGFKYSMDIKQPIAGKTIQYIKLTPSSIVDKRKEILIGIDTKNNHIHNIIEVGKNGTKTTFTVSSFKVNQVLASNHFTFVKSKYPNYYINKAD